MGSSASTEGVLPAPKPILNVACQRDGRGYPQGDPQMTSHSHGVTSSTDSSGLNAMAVSTALHCLTGCAIGEILGLMIGTALGLSTGITTVLAVGLAFLFGYALSTLPLIKAGLGFFAALGIVFAADTLSIATTAASSSPSPRSSRTTTPQNTDPASYISIEPSADPQGRLVGSRSRRPAQAHRPEIDLILSSDRSLAFGSTETTTSEVSRSARRAGPA